MLWQPVMRKMLLRLWNDFKRGTVVALHCMNNDCDCGGPNDGKGDGDNFIHHTLFNNDN